MVTVAGCSSDATDCKLLNTCYSDGTPYTPGEPAPGCRAVPADDAAVINDTCGIFVSASAEPGGNGTKAKPFKSLAEGIAEAKKETFRVYACADGVYAERVELPAGVSVFGGFLCASGDWKYDTAARATIHPAAPGLDQVQASLRVAGPGTSRIENLVVRASDAIFSGGSSIAVIIDGAAANFARTEIVAGSGAAGAQGGTPVDDIGAADPNDPAIRGNDGQNACMGGGNGNPGGIAKGNEACAASVGGAGGFGKETSGDNGAYGLPQDPSGNWGFGGAGEGASPCAHGFDGANGITGTDGVGAQEEGTLDAVRGHVGAGGKSGDRGTVGQGGGGGGGARGSGGSCWGASGGSGGAGGCGGYGGLGGMAGGSSIGIVSLSATLSFEMVNMTTGAGGEGGDGGFGQSGGAGGIGGIGGTGSSAFMTPKGCNGGKGGNGGNGGNGGGGGGGHSIGIAYKGGTVSADGATISVGSAGPGGMGGGAAGGVMAPMHAFP